MWDNVYELKLLKMPLISLCHSALCATSCHTKEITISDQQLFLMTVICEISLGSILWLYFFHSSFMQGIYVYLYVMQLKAKNLIELQNYCSGKGCYRVSCPPPCSKQGQYCIRSPEAFPSEGWRSPIPSPSPHTRCSSLMVVLVASTGLQFIVVFPCIDAVLQTWSNECWVEGHNHFAPSTASVPVIQPNMLQLASDRGIWIILHPMLMFVWVILMGDGILCVYFHEYHYLLFVPCGRKILKY